MDEGWRRPYLADRCPRRGTKPRLGLLAVGCSKPPVSNRFAAHWFPKIWPAEKNVESPPLAPALDPSLPTFLLLLRRRDAMSRDEASGYRSWPPVQVCSAPCSAWIARHPLCACQGLLIQVGLPSDWGWRSTWLILPFSLCDKLVFAVVSIILPYL